MRQMIATALVVTVAGVLVLPQMVTAGDSKSANARLCRFDGYKSLLTSNGERFNNVGDCVSYAARGGVFGGADLSISLGDSDTEGPLAVVRNDGPLDTNVTVRFTLLSPGNVVGPFRQGLPDGWVCEFGSPSDDWMAECSVDSLAAHTEAIFDLRVPRGWRWRSLTRECRIPIRHRTTRIRMRTTICSSQSRTSEISRDRAETRTTALPFRLETFRRPGSPATTSGARAERHALFRDCCRSTKSWDSIRAGPVARPAPPHGVGVPLQKRHDIAGLQRDVRGALNACRGASFKDEVKQDKVRIRILERLGHRVDGRRSKPHGARNSAEEGRPPETHVRNTSDNASRCGAVSPGGFGKVFWTSRKGTHHRGVQIHPAAHTRQAIR